MIRLFNKLRDAQIQIAMKTPGMTPKKVRFTLRFTLISIHRAIARLAQSSSHPRR